MDKEEEEKGRIEARQRRARKRQLKRARFVRAYVSAAGGVAGNATAAARAAGLARTQASARVRGCLMLKDPIVLAMIDREVAAVGADTARILRELGRIAFYTATQVAEAEKAFLDGTVDQLDDATQAVIAGAEVTRDPTGTTRVRIHTHSKMVALDLLARVKKLVGARIEVVGRDGGPIEGVVFLLPAPTRRVVEASPATKPPALPPGREV